MIEFEVYDDDIIEAERRSELMGILSSSRLHGKGNVVGFIGEIITAKYTGGIIADNYDYDILIKDKRVDVKTKSASSKPKGNYLCSVMEYQLGNDADQYVFARVDLTKKKCWLLGYINKERLLSDGIVQKKGDMDGAFEVKEDCRSIRIDQLNHISNLSHVKDDREPF